MYYSRTFDIFAEVELDELLQKKIHGMEAEINGKSDDYILNVNETEFLNYLVNKYSAETLELRFNDVFVTTYEKSIPGERLPLRHFFDVDLDRTYTRDVIKYHIPFAGDESLLRCIPNPRTHWTTEAIVEEGCVCFEVINFYNDPERIKDEADGNMRSIRQQLSHLIDQVGSYNASLLDHAQRLFQTRKQHLLKKNNLLASLGVPIKKRAGFPETFAIPTPQTRKKIQIDPPVVTEKGYKPDPTLDLTVYQGILQVIHDVGKQFERMPSTYANKSEEELRDHILLVLEPRFEGSATGETFNKIGKTDILLRHENTNVFIAECKFWKGAKAYLDTITQLLGYLTWRDSKAAVVMFVQNKEFSSVLKTVETETPKHPNYLGFVSKKEETWLNYRFHISGDRNREVKLAVLLFHIPHI